MLSLKVLTFLLKIKKSLIECFTVNDRTSKLVNQSPLNANSLSLSYFPYNLRQIGATKNTANKNRGNKAFFLLPIVFVCLMVSTRFNGLYAQNFELPLTHFTNDKEINPLPASAVTDVFQDKDGFIWILNYGSGLVRYDGNKMELFSQQEGVGAQLFAIAQDQKSRLWIGSVDKGVLASSHFLDDYLPGDTLGFSTEIEGIPLNSNRITGPSQLVADSFGNLWTSIPGGILRYHYDEGDILQVDTIEVPKYTYGSFLFSFLQHSTGEIWAMSKAPYIMHISPMDGGFSIDSSSFESEPSIKDKNVIHLKETMDGTLWGVNQDGGVWSLVPDQPSQLKLHSNLAGKRIRSLQETKEGYLLASTLGSGLIEWSGMQSENASNYTLRNGLLSTAIWNTTQDNEGNIWLATNTGLSRMPGDYHAFGHYTANAVGGAPNMLPDAGVMGILTDFKWKNPSSSTIEKIVVASTANGISFIRKDGSREIMTANEGLLSNVVLDVYQDSKSRLWVTGREGLSCISQSREALNLPGLSSISQHELWNAPVFIATLPFGHINEVNTLLIPKSEKDNTLVESTWFVGANMLLVLIEEQWFVFARKSGLNPSSMKDIAIDDKNYFYLADAGSGLWISQFPLTVDKIWSLEAVYGKNERYSKFLNIVAPVFERKPILIKTDTVSEVMDVLWLDSLLWTATEYGIAAFEKDMDQPSIFFNEKNGLEVNAVAGLILNQDSSLLWAPSRDGLYGIDLTSQEVVTRVRKKDGLVSSFSWGYPSLSINDEGVLHFATNNGLSLYDPTQDQSDTLAPIVRFRNFQFNEEASGNNELLVEYAALSYTNESGIRYKTRLRGYDTDWSEESSETNIRYTNLPAFFQDKHYAFEVLAGDEEGNWLREPASYAFKVSPPWYFHWLAMIFYGIAAVGLMTWFVRRRTYVLKERQKQLEKIVNERTAEIVAEKERSDELLLNILPAETAEELKKNGSAKAKNFDMVTVIFTDFKGFTQHSEKLSPTELVSEIDHCFKAFDLIMEKHQIEKIKTVGDAYLAAAGLPTPNTSNPADAVMAALDIRDFMQKYKVQRASNEQDAFEIRIGVHTGPVVAGIVGIKKFAYDIWGDTVNLASRMESSSEVGKVNISQSTYEYLKDDHDFDFIPRGKVEAKNKGKIEMYYVERST